MLTIISKHTANPPINTKHRQPGNIRLDTRVAEVGGEEETRSQHDGGIIREIVLSNVGQQDHQVPTGSPVRSSYIWRQNTSEYTLRFRDVSR